MSRKIEQLVTGFASYARHPEMFGAEADLVVLVRDEIEGRRAELNGELEKRLAAADASLRSNAGALFADSPYTAEALRAEEEPTPPPEHCGGTST